MVRKISLENIDLRYHAYTKAMRKRIAPNGIAAATLVKTDRYPGRFEGTTIITGPQDRAHISLYQFLQKTQPKISRIKGLKATPRSSFHMTLAGITQRDRHHQLLRSGEIHTVIAAVNRVLQAHKPAGFIPKFKVSGFFPSFTDAIVAGLEPEDAKSYRALIGIRKSLFSDPVLSRFGTTDEDPVIFHITTHYLVRNEVDRELLDKRLDDLNHAISTTPPLLFPISYLMYAEYLNLKAFARIKGSPLLKF